MPRSAPAWMAAPAPVLAALALALALPALALAHPAPSGAERPDLATGFMHPFTGLDHVLAMTAVGLWGALRGGATRWLAPLTFLALLVTGGVLGAAGFAPGGIEPLVAVSLVAFGLLVAWHATPATPAALVVIGGFALVHGADHGADLGTAPAIAGMALGSAALQAAGQVAGRLLRARAPAWPAALGTGTMAVGAAMLLA